MFHSAGYFRGVLCPFFEHELCHRAYCHFKHSKPGSTKSVSRLPPKLKTRLYQSRKLPRNVEDKPEGPDNSNQNTVTPLDKPDSFTQSVVKNHVGQFEVSVQEHEQKSGPAENVEAGKVDDSIFTVVPEVKKAIGQIANYFGSTQPILEQTPSCQLVEAQTRSDSPLDQQDNVEISTLSEPESLTSLSDGGNRSSSTTIGLLSHETIGRLAGEIAEQIAGASVVESVDVELSVPNYAPEKCSTLDSGYIECLTCVQPTHGVVVPPRQEGLTDIWASAGVGNVDELSHILVTEKDIFGCHGDGSSEDTSITCEPCAVSLEVKATEQTGGRASDGCEDSKAVCSDDGHDVLNRDKTVDAEVATVTSSSSTSSHGERGAVEAGSDDFERCSDDALIEAEFGGCEGTVEESVSDVFEKVSHEVATETGLEDGERTVEASAGDSGEGSINAVVNGDEGTAYTLDEQKAKEEFHKLTAMEEFQKLTAIEEDTTVSASSRKRKLSKADLPVKTKRRAYAQAESVGQREPARVGKAKIIDVNFSAVLKQTDLYMGEKRRANAPTDANVAKRPRLLLTANAKVPTKARQKYVDAFIDEHIKMGVPPQEAYQKALEEEKEIHEENIRSRNTYLNKSHRALKELRVKVDRYTSEKKRLSDERVEIMQEACSPSSKPEANRRDPTVNKMQVRSTGGGPKSAGKLRAKVHDRKQAWKSLEAELQAGFRQPSELVIECDTTDSCKTRYTSKSHSVTRKSSPEVLSSGDALQAIGEKKKDGRKAAKVKSFYGKLASPHNESTKEELSKFSRHRHQMQSKLGDSIDNHATVKFKAVPSAQKSHGNAFQKHLSVSNKSEGQREIPVSTSCKSKDGYLSRPLKHMKKSSHPPSREAEKHCRHKTSGGAVGSTKKLKGQSRNAKKAKVEVSDEEPGPELSLKKSKRAGIVLEVGDNLLPAEQVNKSGMNSSGRMLSPMAVDLTSELFGSDSEDGTFVHSVSSSPSSKQHSTDSKESIIDDRCDRHCLVAASQKDLPSKLSHKCKSAVWSSDDDGVTSNISFESALSSLVKPAKVTRTAIKNQDNASRSKLESASTMQKSSVHVLLDKVPRLKLVRTRTVVPSKKESVETTIDRSDDMLHEEVEIIAKQDIERTIDAQQQAHIPIGEYISLSAVAKQRELAQNKTVIPQRPRQQAKGSSLKTSGQAARQKEVCTRSSNFSILKKREPPPLTSELFYAQMWTYVLTEEQLHDCGYPRQSEEDGIATIHLGDYVPAKIVPVGPNVMRHECCRCHNPFNIHYQGQYQTIESCSYHYGKAFKYKEYGEGMVSRYSCCKERSGSPGCQIAKLHVTAGEALSQVPGYAMTTPAAQGDSKGLTVYALDCEMCYTTVGLELTKVSVVDMTLQPVYESLVRPSHTIVDYNTRFSGITGKDFVGLNKTLADVQDDLLKLFTSETILLGHSLESDLKALKLIHSRVVDTALVFPHRMGLPYKKALKTLTKDILRKFIQDNVDDGHDSLEDSRACMELMLWKVKGDLKVLCRRTSDK